MMVCGWVFSFVTAKSRVTLVSRRFQGSLECKYVCKCAVAILFEAVGMQVYFQAQENENRHDFKDK